MLGWMTCACQKDVKDVDSKPSNAHHGDGMLLAVTNALERSFTGATCPVGYQALASRVLGEFDKLGNLVASNEEGSIGSNGLTPESLTLLRRVAWVRDPGNDRLKLRWPSPL